MIDVWSESINKTINKVLAPKSWLLLKKLSEWWELSFYYDILDKDTWEHIYINNQKQEDIMRSSVGKTGMQCCDYIWNRYWSDQDFWHALKHLGIIPSDVEVPWNIRTTFYNHKDKLGTNGVWNISNSWGEAYRADDGAWKDARGDESNSERGNEGR